MHKYKKPSEGYIFRSKANPDDFSSALYIGEGRSIDEWEEVPLAVYEEHQREQATKMMIEVGEIHEHT